MVYLYFFLRYFETVVYLLQYFLAVRLTMFCGTLVGRHSSTHFHPDVVYFTDHSSPPHYFQYTIRTENMLLFLSIIFVSRGPKMAYCDWTIGLKTRGMVVRFPAREREFSLLRNVHTGSGAHPADTGSSDYGVDQVQLTTGGLGHT